MTDLGTSLPPLLLTTLRPYNRSLEHPNLDTTVQNLLPDRLIPKQRLPEILPNLRNTQKRSILYTSPHNNMSIHPQNKFRMVRTGIAERQVQKNHRLLPDMQRLGIRQDLADSIGCPRREAYFRLLQVFNLFRDFKVFREQLQGVRKERVNAMQERIGGRGGVPLRSLPVVSAPWF